MQYCHMFGSEFDYSDDIDSWGLQGTEKQSDMPLGLNRELLNVFEKYGKMVSSIVRYALSDENEN